MKCYKLLVNNLDKEKTIFSAEPHIFSFSFWSKFPDFVCPWFILVECLKMKTRAKWIIPLYLFSNIEQGYMVEYQIFNVKSTFNWIVHLSTGWWWHLWDFSVNSQLRSSSLQSERGTREVKSCSHTALPLDLRERKVLKHGATSISWTFVRHKKPTFVVALICFHVYTGSY